MVKDEGFLYHHKDGRHVFLFEVLRFLPVLQFAMPFQGLYQRR